MQSKVPYRSSWEGLHHLSERQLKPGTFPYELAVSELTLHSAHKPQLPRSWRRAEEGKSILGEEPEKVFSEA